MDGLRLRRAGPGDAEALSVVGAASFLDAFIETIPGPDLIAHCRTQHAPEIYSAWLSDDDAQVACWLVEHGETRAPVGYAAVTAPDASVEPWPGDLELKRIYALSRFHGSGAGQALMEAAIAHAGARGAPRLLLGTYEGNERAVAFYGRNGFETVGTRRFRVGDQVFDDIIMARSLG